MADGVRCDWLDTSHAFHSALLDPILDEFESYAERFNFSPPQRILIDNRTGAALGRSVKLDGAYWRRHARQPVEFAKSVRTLADLNCKVLLEIGPQPVLTAAALRAWPDPATAPRAIASLRRNTADHRQITEAVADAYVLGHLPDFGAFRQARTRKLDLPTYPFERREYWFRDNRDHAKQQQHLDGPRTEAVRLLEDGRIEELATLLDGASGDRQTLNVLTKLAAQHNQQRTTQSIADDRYEIRWEKSTTPISNAEPGEGSAWILVGDDTDAVQPLVDVLTARGHRHRIFGLPVSDADEEELADALRAAAADDPTLRIVHVSGPRLRDRTIDAVTAADATPDPGRNTAALPCRDRRRTAHTHLGGDQGRATSHRRGHRVAGSELPMGIRSRRIAGASAGVGRTGGSG